MSKEIQVLFLDDEQSIVEGLQRLFMREPYGILATSSVSQAREVLSREKIKVVVSDYRMPDISGVKFLKEVKDNYPDAVKVLFTGYTDSSAAEEAINVGEVYRFVSKPWKTVELLQTIRQCIEHHDLVMEARSKRELLELSNARMEELIGTLKGKNKALSDLQFALDNAAIVAITDPDGKITYVNDKFCEISQYSRQELLGQDHRMIKSDFHSREFMQELWETISSGKVWNGEVKNRKKNGEFYWVSTTIVPFLDDNGKPLQYIAIRYDITAMKELEKSLQESNQKLKEIYERQKEFTSTVSHELRTPLASIKTGIDLVLKKMVGEINPQQEDILGRAKNEVDRLKRLINDVLDLTKMESGKMKMHMMANNINNVIQQTVESQKDVAGSRGLYLKVEPDQNMPLVIFDTDRLIQVMNNLLSNAIKFTREGGITITTVGKPENNHILVCVRDTGKGIAEKDLLRLFEKFQQIESAQANEEGGTGLGLAICKEIIERHGGKIWVESKPGEGTSFKFILPIQDRRESKP